jgi:aromatic ring-opening dioxygenase catalytic subunit (LigB family)
MKNEVTTHDAPVLYFSHGGGPLPLLGDPEHQAMVDWMRTITRTVGSPDAILLISAHWEEPVAKVTGGPYPSLIYDYYGFPEETYRIQYPAPGAPELAEKVFQLLRASGLEARNDRQRGFDHGMFVPLILMYPEAAIPCVQLSLLKSLDPEAHIRMGQALSELRKENLLIIGSGFSFHNLRALMARNRGERDVRNEEFDRWLIDTCTNESLFPEERARRLVEWEQAPSARYCHPREEHLLPLHVCYGLANAPALLVFNDQILGKMASAFLW